MWESKTDYSILDKLAFEHKPVGIQFTLKKPEGIEILEDNLAICEMFRKAQTSKPFYSTAETTQCGNQVIGYEEFPPMMYSGQLGPHFSMFKTPQANRQVYDYIRTMPKDSVKYVVHSSIDQLTFEPDVILLTANTRQAEIIMRASSFSDGKMWEMKGSTCLACVWLYSYPYLSGNMNFSISGLGFSMKARNVLPEGLMIIAVPAPKIRDLLDNLNTMEWEPDWFKIGRDNFVKAVKQLDKDVMADLGIL